MAGARDFESGNLEWFGHADNADFSTGDIDFTLQAWINIETVAANLWILSKEGVANGEYELQVDAVGTLTWRVYASSGYGGAQAVTWGSALSAATWYLVHAWHDSVNNQIGVAVNAGTAVTAAHTTGVVDTTDPFEIGALSFYGRHFDGLIDEVGFWKRVLSSAERTELYNGGAGRDYAYIAGGAVGHPAARRLGGIRGGRPVEIGREGVMVY